VWFAPLEEIAEHTRAVIAAGKWAPRVEQLPFYDRPLDGVMLTGSGVLPG
jgi:hypothetical protein